MTEVLRLSCALNTTTMPVRRLSGLSTCILISDMTQMAASQLTNHKDGHSMGCLCPPPPLLMLCNNY